VFIAAITIPSVHCGLRVTTDIAAVRRVAPPSISVIAYPVADVPGKWKRRILLLAAALRSDHLLVEFEFADIAFFVFFLFVLPNKCRITTLDFFVVAPPAALKPFVRWTLGRITRFLVYFRDSSDLAARFRLSTSAFRYVPFKINGIETIRAKTPQDDGYIFSGGRSRRDFATFFAAVGPTGHAAKLFTGSAAELAPNGSSLANLEIPENVEILNRESGAEAFLDAMSRARIVVIPLRRDSITQAGIGVYIQAMAMRKCVIVTAGLGVSDVLTEGQALIVPAGDPEALRAAIERVWHDRVERERYAEAGFRYSSGLGGEDDLARRLLSNLPELS
jgi:glycosyltransferase involved in cell wall biosynthesis